VISQLVEPAAVPDAVVINAANLNTFAVPVLAIARVHVGSLRDAFHQL